MSKLLIRFSQSPYGNALAQDGLDFALAATNYGHDVAVLFEGEGVLQLAAENTNSDTSSFLKRLSVLPLFDIEECYVCAQSLEALDLVPVKKIQNSLALQAINLTEKLKLFEQVKHTVIF